MNNTIVYRPHQSDLYFAGAMFVAGILSFAAFGCCLSGFGAVCYIYAGMGSLSLWLAKTLFNSSQLRLLFEQEGIWIVGGKDDNKFIPWNKYVYAYYVRSYKGHLFLVLSPQVLSLRQAKAFANHGANTSKTCVDNACVIYLKCSAITSRIKELIGYNVLHIDIYQK